MDLSVENVHSVSVEILQGADCAPFRMTSCLKGRAVPIGAITQ